jgi:hypothetical protein
MNATVAPQAVTPLGQGKANATPGSTEDIPVKAEPQAYLRLDTGEVYGVPAADVPTLHNEFDKWNRLIHEQLLANEVLALADERLLLIAMAKGQNPASVSKDIEADARTAQGLAIKWREQATEAVRKEMQALDKLGSTGKNLIELVPLMDKAEDKPHKTTPDTANGDWKQKSLDLNRKWNVKTAIGIRDKFEQEARYRGLGPLRYVNSDTLAKKNWPKFKDKKSMKWAEVYKEDEAGKRKIDRTKMKQYLGEQVMAAKASSKDFIKLEISNVGTLGPEALEKWNANMRASGEGKVVWGDVELGDVDFSAEAAAMRYYSGGSLSGEIEPLKGNVNIKAEGGLEVAFAEGKVAGNLYLPSKEGLMLYWLDIEQIAAAANGASVETTRYDLGAVRLACATELKGVIGVSLAGEVSIGVEMKDIDTQDVDGKTKPGKMPHIKGTNKKVKRKSAANVSGKGDDWKNTAGAAASVNFFAGAKGGVGLTGAIEWRNPHNKEKKFEPFASIAPELQGMAGLAGEARLAIEYVDGIFRITAHAGLCFGLGAEGTVTLAVGAKQLASFMYWFYYNLLNLGFRNLSIIQDSAFRAGKYLGYLVVAEGQAVTKYFGRQLNKGTDTLERALTQLEMKFRKESETLELAKRVLENPAALRHTPPESKGMLIYMLTRFGAVSWALDGGGLGSNYLPTQRQAVLAVLHQTQTKRDIKNVIEHIHLTGDKVSFDQRLVDLKRFFAAEGPSGLDFPGTRTQHQDRFQELMRQRGHTDFVALNGDFGAWYDQTHAALMDEAPRGYPAMDNSEFAYALIRDGRGDHPLFASSGNGFYSDTV